MICVWRYKLRKLTATGRQSFHGLHLTTTDGQRLLDKLGRAIERGHRELVLELDPPDEIMSALASYLIYGQKDAAVFLRQLTLRFKLNSPQLLEVSMGEVTAKLTLNQEGIAELTEAFDKFEAGEYHWSIVDSQLERQEDQWLTVHPFPKQTPDAARRRAPYGRS